MGYRSEVAYVIEFEDIATKKEWVALAKLDEQFSRALKECKFVDDMEKAYISAYFAHVKWYHDFEDVKSHMRMLNSLEGEDCMEGISARFMRVGEEDNDNEDVAFGEDGYDIPMYINRYIDTEYELGEVEV